jgi:dTDP-4-dehydrorhamnose reductase
MKIMITGAKGMLGRTLVRQWSRHECTGVDIPDFDIRNAQTVDSMIEACRPDVLVHCAAMTAVDECEKQPERAWGINAIGCANMASACNRYGIRLVSLSTDYVFSGNLGRPYNEFDETHPNTVYGASKLAGENAVRELCPNHLVVRIAWLYGPGGPSFVHTMLKYGAEKGEPLTVVNDQIGNPTSTEAVATCLANLLEIPVTGTIHMSCEGEASWYDLAVEILRLSGLKREITPCATADYPTPARRPADSRLDNYVLRLRGLPPMPDWREALEKFLAESPDV